MGTFAKIQDSPKISNMKDIYEEIVESDPSLAVNLKGWKNRVRAFQLIP